jgi:hypothetical protein
MFTFLSRGATRLSAGAWLRLITALAAVTGGVLAWAAAVPAASAAIIPVPGPAGAYGPASAAGSATPVRVITSGGMPGWQITLIAITTALVAGTAAVVLDRVRASRRATATTG